jgi:hypothetical protein
MTPITVLPIPMLFLAATAVTVQTLLFRRWHKLPEANYRAQAQTKKTPRVRAFEHPVRTAAAFAARREA